MFYPPSPQYAVEEIHQFGTNIVSFQLEMGEQKWYIIRCYLSPDDISMIESAVKAIKECPRGAELLVVGDFKVKLEDPQGDWKEEEIAEVLNMEGLEDMLDHFHPWRLPWCRYGREWRMVQEGEEVRSQTDYTLGTDRDLFRNVAVRDPQHNLDHYLVLGFILGSFLREHTKYLGRSTCPPIRPPATLTWEGGLFLGRQVEAHF